MRKYLSIAGLTLFSCIIFISCKEEKSKNVIKTTSVSFTKEGELQLLKAETDSIVQTIAIEIADNDYETQTGLMYRTSMEEKQGMLFVFDDMQMHSFYMKNTKIPLDIIYIDDNYKIASFQENAKPMDETGLTSKVPVQYVLELNAGLVKKWGLQIGDKIAYQKI